MTSGFGTNRHALVTENNSMMGSASWSYLVIRTPNTHLNKRRAPLIVKTGVSSVIEI